MPSASGELAKVLRWTLGVPAAAIGVVVMLFGLGAMWKWGQVREAGLVPTDVLPLVPQAQLLALGTQLVLVAALAVPVTLGLTWLLHLALPRRRAPWGAPRGLARVLAEQERLRRDLTDLKEDARPQVDGFDRRVRRLHTRAEKVSDAAVRRLWALRAALVAGIVVAVFLSTPGRIAVALFGLWALRRAGGSALRVAVAVFAALVLVVTAERFTAPAPLPDASVRTTRGLLIKGPLVTAKQEGWYVVVAERRLKAIPSANIAKSSVASGDGGPSGALGARPIDLFR